MSLNYTAGKRDSSEGVLDVNLPAGGAFRIGGVSGLHAIKDGFKQYVRYLGLVDSWRRGVSCQIAQDEFKKKLSGSEFEPVRFELLSHKFLSELGAVHALDVVKGGGPDFQVTPLGSPGFYVEVTRAPYPIDAQIKMWELWLRKDFAEYPIPFSVSLSHSDLMLRAVEQGVHVEKRDFVRQLNEALGEAVEWGVSSGGFVVNGVAFSIGLFRGVYRGDFGRGSIGGTIGHSGGVGYAWVERKLEDKWDKQIKGWMGKGIQFKPLFLAIGLDFLRVSPDPERYDLEVRKALKRFAQIDGVLTFSHAALGAEERTSVKLILNENAVAPEPLKPYQDVDVNIGRVLVG